jgi:hypothetical protein
MSPFPEVIGLTTNIVGSYRNVRRGQVDPRILTVQDRRAVPTYGAPDGRAMDEPGSDDTISLRACAAELRPEEVAAITAANERLNALVVMYSYSDLEGWGPSDEQAISKSWSLEEALVCSSLLNMATAIVDVAAAGRAIWRDSIKLPVSFFVAERDVAIKMIAEGLEQDNEQFRVLRVQAVVGSAPAKPTDFVGLEKRPTQREQITLWLVGKGKAYINSRARTDIANDYKREHDLPRKPSLRQIDRAKGDALKELKNAPNRAK